MSKSILQEILEEALPEYGFSLTDEQLKELAYGISVSLDCSNMVSHLRTGGAPSRIDWESKYKALEREFNELKSNTNERLRDYSWAMREKSATIRALNEKIETCQSRSN